MGQLAVTTESTPPDTPNPVSANVTPPESNGGRDSPLAFSHYQHDLKPVEEKAPRRNPKPPLVVSPPTHQETKGKKQKQKPEDDEHSGCCAGCVIM